MTLEPPDPPLTDGIVTLRPWRATDARSLVAAIHDPEISRWTSSVPYPYRDKDARAFLELARAKAGEGSAAYLAIVDAAGDTLLGGIGIDSVDWRLQTRRREGPLPGGRTPTVVSPNARCAP
jgi:[ribosomal protein S5]-alanine N-acetyltransferase